MRRLLLIALFVASVCATHCVPQTVYANSTGAFERAFEVHLEPAGYLVLMRITDTSAPGYNAAAGHVTLDGVLPAECRAAQDFWHIGTARVTQTSGTFPPIVTITWVPVGFLVHSDTGSIDIYQLTADQVMADWPEQPTLYPVDFATQYTSHVLE